MLGKLFRYSLSCITFVMIVFIWDIWLEEIPQEFEINSVAVVNSTTNNYSKIPLIQMERIQRIKDTCSKLNKTRVVLHRRNFLINHTRKLLYCWIHKVASTSWIALFSLLMNQTEPEDLYYRKIMEFSTNSTEELRNASYDEQYLKFIIVRHPFERLVSAYRDRIEDNSKKLTHQAKKYAGHILSYTRPSHFNTSLTFYHKKLVTVPTFEEFVRWLLHVSPNEYDVHWNSYYTHCAPCNINYDVVVKLENKTEINALFQSLTQFNTAGEIKMPELQKSKGGKTTFEITCRYLSQLSQEQIQNLYEIFKNDFILFDYSPSLYLDCNSKTKNGTIGIKR